jgi:site-specific DNA-cytosine methylase
VPLRRERLKALGNGVVPQVARLVGQRVIELARAMSP